MKVVGTKALMILTCICVLQSSITSEAAETTAAKPQSSLLSKLKQKAQDKAASITSAMKPSKIKNGIKVKLVKVNAQDRKQLWTAQVSTAGIEAGGNLVENIKFYKDTMVTFDTSRPTQGLRVYANGTGDGEPVASTDIYIYSGKIKNHDPKTEVLAVSSSDIKVGTLVFDKGILWLKKTEAEKIIKAQSGPSFLEKLRKKKPASAVPAKATPLTEQEIKAIKTAITYVKGENQFGSNHIGGFLISNDVAESKVHLMLHGNAFYNIISNSITHLSSIKTILTDHEKEYPETLNLITTALKWLNAIYKPYSEIQPPSWRLESENEYVAFLKPIQDYLQSVDKAINSLSQTFETELKAQQEKARQTVSL